jgi:hypothetical protein
MQLRMGPIRTLSLSLGLMSSGNRVLWYEYRNKVSLRGTEAPARLDLAAKQPRQPQSNHNMGQRQVGKLLWYAAVLGPLIKPGSSYGPSA